MKSRKQITCEMAGAAKARMMSSFDAVLDAVAVVYPGAHRELAGYQNSVYDGATVEEITPSRDFYFERCVSRGGDPERIKSEFSELWP